MLNWRLVSDLVTVRYEDIVGDNGPEASNQVLQALTAHVIGDEREAGQIDLPAIKQRDTITASERRSRWQEWWSDVTEAAFERLGGNEINYALGYE